MSQRVVAESSGMRWNGDPRRDAATTATISGSGSTRYIDWCYEDGTPARSLVLNGTDFDALVQAVESLPLETREGEMRARVYGGPLSGTWMIGRTLRDRLEAIQSVPIPVDTPATDSMVIPIGVYELRRFADYELRRFADAANELFWVYTLPGRDPCFLCEGDRTSPCPQCWGEGDMPRQEG